MVIDDWVGHINWLIVASAYTEHSIVKFDETNVDFQVGVLSCWGAVQQGTSFLPSSSGRELKEEEFIGTVGCKTLSWGRCTPYNCQDGWMGRHSMSGYVK
jgi:hypothetical protein